MHIKKNICKSILGTLINIPGRTKDNLKSRLYLLDIGIKKSLHPKCEKTKCQAWKGKREVDIRKMEIEILVELRQLLEKNNTMFVNKASYLMK